MTAYAADDARDPGREVQQALDRFKLAAEADEPQRKRELEDIAFVDKPETQWPSDIREARKGGTYGTVVTPARPCLALSQLNAPIDQVMNQARNARLAIRINPKSGGASKATAETIQGLYRNIEVESRAQIARNWAFDRALKGGRGYYRILKAYANDGDDDLDIVIARILNQHSVYLDPFHQEPDGSDAEWAFIVADIPWARYKREYKEKKGNDGKPVPSVLAGYDTDQLESLGASAPGWMNGEGEARTVRVAEYFCVHEDEKDGKTRRYVKWQTINAVEVLDEQEWEGRYIPIVQVIGKEININGERRYVGIVGPAKDAQRSYNYMRSAEVEAIGLAPKAPWIVMEGQIEGYEQEWRQANVRNVPVLTYRPKNLGGTFAPPPQRNVAEPPIQAMALASRQARDDIQSITGQFDPAQGKASYAGQSGKAIQALQQQTEQGTSGFLDNLANISMVYEARIVIDLMAYVYNRPGRVVKILTGDDDSASNVMLNKPFTRAPQSEQPIEPPPGTPPEQIEHYMLRPEDQYSCTVSIGKSFTTRMQEGNAMMGELAQAIPNIVPLYADIWVRNMDMPGGEEIADRLKKMLPPALQDEGQVNPADMQAQMQQMQMQMQEMGAALQEAQSGLQAKAMEIQSKEKIAAAELELKAQIAQLEHDLAVLKEQNKLAIEQQKIGAKQQEAAINADIERESQERQAQIDREKSEVDLHHAELQAQTAHTRTMEQQAARPQAGA